MNALVTGANGFVGSNLCETLVKKGIKVRGLVRKTSDLTFLEGLDIEPAYGSLNDRKSLEIATKNIDIVYHAAAITSDWGPMEALRRANVEGTGNILAVSYESGVKRFVHISSIAVHDCHGKQDVDESYPSKAALSSYCITKIEAEKIVMEFYKKYNFPVTIIRPGDVFGPKDRISFLKMVKSLQTRTLPYINHGRALFPYTYVENLVEGIILAGANEKAIGQVYIITDGIKVTWKKYFKTLTAEMGIKEPVYSINGNIACLLASILEFIYRTLHLKNRPPITKYLAAHLKDDIHFSIGKAREELGYKTEVSFEESIKRTVRWYREYSQNIT